MGLYRDGVLLSFHVGGSSVSNPLLASCTFFITLGPSPEAGGRREHYGDKQQQRQRVKTWKIFSRFSSWHREGRHKKREKEGSRERLTLWVLASYILIHVQSFPLLQQQRSQSLLTSLHFTSSGPSRDTFSGCVFIPSVVPPRGNFFQNSAFFFFFHEL